MFSRNSATGSSTVTSNNKNSNKVIIRNNQGHGIMVNRNSQAYRNYLARQNAKNKSFIGRGQTTGGISLNLLNDFTAVQLRMFYVNTYNTFAYFSGQYINDIDDGEVIRYMIFLELIINKLNRKSIARERELSELWNKSLGMKTFGTNHDKILTRYRNIMEHGFVSNGGNISSILNNAKK